MSQPTLVPQRVRRISRSIERAMTTSDIPGVRVVEVRRGVATTAVGLPATEELLAALESAWDSDAWDAATFDDDSE